MKTHKRNKDSRTTKGAARSSVQRDGSVTELDGYRAAGIIIEKALRAADLKCPKRIPRNIESADVRYGYYKGLLVAHCQMALGEHPTHELNKPVILETLKSLNDKLRHGGENQ